MTVQQSAVKTSRWDALAWIGGWLACLLTAWATRPLWVIDETRYASVAWEMWRRGEFLVPYLNGTPYSDKPPFMFWCVLAGWKLFGVSEWWLRLVPPLFGLGSLFLSRLVARELWPERDRPAQIVPWLLLGTAAWSFFSTVLLFDLIQAFFTLLALLGILIAWRHGRPWGWALTGIAIGLGLLTKGPVIFLYVLPAALLAPWWGKQEGLSLARWYLGVAGAVVLGAAIALAWALPAARAGGAEYESRILWHQTADRIVRSPAHAHPVWWYLPWLPVLAFPWSMIPAVRRGVGRLVRQPGDSGVRFCTAWLIPGLVLFSLISGKGVHYLLPLYPAFALLAARAVGDERAPWTRRELAPSAGVLLAIAFVLAIVPPLKAALPGVGGKLPSWVSDVSPLGGVVLALGAIALLTAGRRNASIPALSLASLLLIVVVHADLVRAAAPSYDVRPAAVRIREWQDQGSPIAHAGRYEGQFHFLGRLEHPIARIEASQAREWIRAHPTGKVIAYHRNWPVDVPAAPDFAQPFRGRMLAVWGQEAIRGARTWPPPPLAGDRKPIASRAAVAGHGRRAEAVGSH